MLVDFITRNRDELVARTQAMVVRRSDPPPPHETSRTGIPMFLDQMVATLERGTRPTHERMTRSATAHGAALLAGGYSVSQVVHNYGDLGQAITELAHAVDAPIAADEFQVLTSCLDDAIAEAITEYTRLRDQSMVASETARSGVFAHDLRSKLSAAILGFEAISSGRAPAHGSVATIVAKSLHGIRDLVDRSILEARVDSGASRGRRSPLAGIVANALGDAVLEARRRGVMLSVGVVDAEIDVEVDELVLEGVLANLVQNALQFTPKGGLVRIRNAVVGASVQIEVEDECGGLLEGDVDGLFRPSSEGTANRGGLGLGLFICRKGIETSGGTLRARDLPGVGCVFSVALPLCALRSRPAT